MKTYEIEMTEVARVYYRVEAESDEAAIEKFEDASVFEQVKMMVDLKNETHTLTSVRVI
mgnify:CR=1 FL=1|jgi:hypothetical protein